MISTPTGRRLPAAAVAAALALTAPSLPAAAAEMDDAIYTFFQLDQNEYRLNDDGDQAYAWEAQGWIGTDYDKLFLKSEGEQPLDAPLEKAEVQVLLSSTTVAWCPSRTRLPISIAGTSEPPALSR